MDVREYLTPVEAAIEAKVSADVIRAALRRYWRTKGGLKGGLKGVQERDRWFVHPKELAAWIEVRGDGV